MRNLFLVLILSATVMMQGCMAFLASQAGYAEAKTKYSRFYEFYKFEQEKINADRVKNGLSPMPLEEYNAWLKEQPLSRNEIKVFKMYGDISPEEAKVIRQREGYK